jgi:hypothetical protein
MTATRVKWGPQCSHRAGQSWLTTWTPDKVAAAPDPIVGLANYMQQNLGIAYPTMADLAAIRHHANDIAAYYPAATTYTLCRVVQYVRSKKRRPTRGAQAMGMWREAMAAGYLNELDPNNDQALIDQIYVILETETDERWRRRLLCCADNDSRRLAISDWRTFRAPIVAA